MREFSNQTFVFSALKHTLEGRKNRVGTKLHLFQFFKRIKIKSIRWNIIFFKTT